MKRLRTVKNRPNKAKVTLILMVIVVVTGGVAWYVSSQQRSKNDKKTTAPEYFGSYEQLNSVPSRTDASTNDPGILVAWMDQRVIDGNLSCTVYRKNDRRVLAVYTKTAGFNAERKVSSSTDYKNSDVPKSTIDKIVEDYCGAN